jgi:hypothetical protein
MNAPMRSYTNLAVAVSCTQIFLIWREDDILDRSRQSNLLHQIKTIVVRRVDTHQLTISFTLGKYNRLPLASL